MTITFGCFLTFLSWSGLLCGGVVRRHIVVPHKLLYECSSYINYEFLSAISNRFISSLVERPSSDRKDPGSIPGQGSLSTFTTSIFVEDNKTLIRTSTWKLSSRNWRSPYWKKNCSHGKKIVPTAAIVQLDNEYPNNQKLLRHGNNRK